ncbi:hypothetical protein Tco_0117683 [Tanacetum coccineum]
MSTQQDMNAFRAQRLANTHDPLALMANTQTSFHPNQSSLITYLQHLQPNNNFVPQPLCSTKYIQQPMHNSKDSSDPITAMIMALALMAKAFKVNTIPTNNNQRSSLISRNSQIAQPGINTSQDIKMQMVDDDVGNQIDQEEEAGIQSTQEEFEFMIAADAHEETKRVKVNCILEDTLQQASTSRTQSDNVLVYDSDGSAEVPKDENCYDHDIFNILTQEVQYTDLQTELDRTNQKLETCIIKKEKEYATLWNNWNHKRYENQYLGKPPSSSYKPKLNFVTPIPKSLVLPKVDKMNPLSKPVTSKSTPSTRESKVVKTVNVIAPRIFRTNPFKTSRVDNFVHNKPIRTSVRIKPITISKPNVIYKQQANFDSNGFSSTRVNNTAKTRGPHPRSNSNTDRVPSKSKSSCLSNNIEKIEENHRNSQIPKNRKHLSSECNNITLAIRNDKSEIVCVMCKQCLVTANHDVCVLNYMNDMNSRADKQTANVLIRENKNKYKANAKKLKELGSKGSLASSKPSKPRTCLKWIPTGRIFSMCGKLTASNNTENKSEKFMCDNASTSNPSEPSSKGFFLILLLFLAGYQD